MIYILNSLINKNKVLILHHMYIWLEQSLNPRGKVLTGHLKMPCQHCCYVFLTYVLSLFLYVKKIPSNIVMYLQVPTKRRRIIR